MIKIFPSLHIDPDEIVELKRMLSGSKKRKCIIAIELESNAETSSALARFRRLKDKEINKVLEYQFGERRIIASFKFMKLAAKYTNITKLVSIEPRQGKRIRELSNRVSKTYNRLQTCFKYTKSHYENRKVIERLIRLHYEFTLAQATQCSFREKNMAKVVMGLAENNPQSDIIVYCSYAHSGAIKYYLRKKGLMFITRKGGHTVNLENWWFNLAETVKKSYAKLNSSNREEICRDLVFEHLVWDDQKDMNIEKYFMIKQVISKMISSEKDIRNFFADTESFKGRCGL